MLGLSEGMNKRRGGDGRRGKAHRARFASNGGFVPRCLMGKIRQHWDGKFETIPMVEETIGKKKLSPGRSSSVAGKNEYQRIGKTSFLFSFSSELAWF